MGLRKPEQRLVDEIEEVKVIGERGADIVPLDVPDFVQQRERAEEMEESMDEEPEDHIAKALDLSLALANEGKKKLEESIKWFGSTGTVLHHDSPGAAQALIHEIEDRKQSRKPKRPLG